MGDYPRLSRRVFNEVKSVLMQERQRKKKTMYGVTLLPSKMDEGAITQAMQGMSLQKLEEARKQPSPRASRRITALSLP